MAVGMQKKGFTLIELMVAVGLMGLIIAFSSVIFRFGIDAHRISSANAEIMQKARAITEQLNSDLKGLRQDAPLLIWFQQDVAGTEPNRYDQMMFFADGDFSSWRLYRPGGGPNARPVPLDVGMNASDKVVRGNLARIQYALASRYVSATNHSRVQPYDPDVKDKAERNLARRCHILTADDSLEEWPDGNNVGTSIDNPGESGEFNEEYEHDSVPISRWKALDNTDFGATMGGMIIRTCIDNYPPLFDSRDPNTFGKLLCEGVSSFKIQWAYWDRLLSSDPYELRWFPGDNPDGDKLTNDSHFEAMDMKYGEITAEPEFGSVFNVRGNQQMNMWMPPGMLYYDQTDTFADNFFPNALKFTFTVYDSKGIIKGGRTFTHIVYLED